MKRYAIIVAGGKGLRMGGELPKQFISLEGKPLLMHTLHRFHSTDPTLQLILVLPASHIALWEELCKGQTDTPPHRIVAGGATRYESVAKGLALVDEAGVVAVHDGVRPFVSPHVIEKAYSEAAQHGAVVPALPLVDSLRSLEDASPAGYAVDRELYRLVQTPQVFRSTILQRAYNQPFQPHFTDDASVVEAAGFTIRLIEGNRENIKVTTPFDLIIAQALLTSHV